MWSSKASKRKQAQTEAIAMAWIYLLAAGLCEVMCTTIFRYTEGLTRVGPTVSFFALGVLSFYLLYKSLSDIPLGTAYGIWTGIGAAGTALIGIMIYNEPATAARLAFLTLLIGSIVGLKFVTPS
jgi:quaternary ammonium compound-resistance protein SugE